MLISLIELLLFIPGILLLTFISEKIGARLSRIEKIIDGAVIWNYFFGLSALIGLIPHALHTFFPVFTLVSILVTLITAIWYVIKLLQKPRSFKIGVKRDHVILIPYVLLVSIILSIVLIIAVNAPLSGEWDVWAVWLPTARSFYERGDLLFNEYLSMPRQMHIGYPPLMPLLNAWSLALTGTFSQMYSIIYCILLCCLIFKLGNTLTNDFGIAFGGSLGIMISVLSISVLFVFPLHPEIIATFFFYTSIYYVMKLAHSVVLKKYYAIMLGFSLSLLLWTRKFGFVLAYFTLLFMSLFLPVSATLRRIFFLVAYLLPLVILFPEKLPLILLYFCMLLVLTFKLTNADLPSVKWEILLYVAVGLLPCILFFVIVGQVSGMWFYTIKTNPVDLKAYSEFVSLFPPKIKQITISSLLRIDDIFLRLFMIQHTIPFVIGTLFLVGSRSSSNKFILLLVIFFLSLFVIRPENFYPSLCPELSFLRRHLYLLPLMSLTSSLGLYGIYRIVFQQHYEGALLHKTIPSLVYFPLSTVYVLSKQEVINSWPKPFNGLLNISGLKVPLSNIASLDDILWLVILILCSYGFAIMIANFRCSPLFRRGCSSIFVILLMATVPITASAHSISLFYRPISDSLNYGYKLRLSPPNWAEDVVNYFNNNINCGDVIMGWTIYYLATFSTKKVVDLSLYYGYFTLKDSLKSGPNKLLSRLKSLGVKCIVIPKNEHLPSYRIFVKYVKKFPALIDLFENKNVTCTEISQDYGVCQIS